MYVTPKEFAARMHITPQCATNWCRQGKLDAIQVGGKKGAWRIWVDDDKPKKTPTQ